MCPRPFQELKQCPQVSLACSSQCTDLILTLSDAAGRSPCRAGWGTWPTALDFHHPPSASSEEKLLPPIAPREEEVYPWARAQCHFVPARVCPSWRPLGISVVAPAEVQGVGRVMCHGRERCSRRRGGTGQPQVTVSTSTSTTPLPNNKRRAGAWVAAEGRCPSSSLRCVVRPWP